VLLLSLTAASASETGDALSLWWWLGDSALTTSLLFGAEDLEVRGFGLSSAGPALSSVAEAVESAIFRDGFEDLFDCIKLF
jgi:hypothetical protein